MAERIVLTGDEAAAVRALGPSSRGRKSDPNSTISRLRAGDVVWFAGGISASASAYRTALRKEGTVRVRTAERDGTKGIYVWLERKAA